MKGKIKTFELAKNIEQEKYPINEVSESKSASSIENIHLENHLKASKEITHSFDSLGALDFSIPSSEEGPLWNEIETALQEKDVIDLRANLGNIIAEPISEISDFELDEFIDLDLDEFDADKIELALTDDLSLQNNLQLHHEINEAISETQVFDLRKSIATIIEEENSSNNAIDDFLLDNLNEIEREFFQNNLAGNTHLANALKLHSEINEAILEDDVIRLRGTLKAISTEKNQSNKTLRLVSLKPKNILKVASTVAAAIAIGLILHQPKTVDFDQVYQANYQPYDAVGFVRSASTTMDMASYGIDLYNYNEYQRAINVFANVLDEHPNQPLANFYSGLSNQQLENYQLAISFYNQVIQDKDNLFVEQAEWYKALCLLKTENKATGIQLVNKNFQ